MINKNIYILIGIMVIIGAFVAYDFNREDTLLDNDKKEITDGNVGIILSDDDRNADIKQIPITDTNDIKKEQEIDYPELTSSIVFPDSLSEDARVIIANNIATLINKLEKEENSFGGWFDLAAQYKIIEDYESTRDIWEFLGESFTGNNTVFSNLGNLYHYDLKDFPKSEESFRKAIENDKSNIQSYIGLHELYKYSYKQETSLVIDILIEGIEDNPINIDLMITLANYYKERGNMSKGDQTNAQKYYEQAREKAQKLGNTQLIEAITQEISNL